MPVESIDSWEDGNFNGWTQSYGNGTITTNFATDGTSGVEASNGLKERLESQPGDGLPTYPVKGDTIYLDMESSIGDATAATTQVQVHFGWDGVDDEYRLDVDVQGGALELWELGSQQARIGVDWGLTVNANTHYEIKIVWDDGTLGGADGDITATLRDVAADTVTASVSANSTYRSDGGVKIFQTPDTGERVNVDYFRVERPASSSPQTAVIDGPAGLNITGYNVQTTGGVVTETTTIVDSWEDGNTNNWTVIYGDGSITTNFATEGTSGYEVSGGLKERLESTSGLPIYPEKGTKFYLDFETTVGSATATTGEVHLYFGWDGVDDEYRVDCDIQSGNLEMWELGSSQQRIAVDFGASYAANTAYQLEIVWDDGTISGADGDITATVTEIGSGTVVSTITANSAYRINGGVKIFQQSDTGGRVNVDNFHVVEPGNAAPTNTTSQTNIGGGTGYGHTVDPSEATVTVSTLSGITSALSSASAGDIVYIDGSASIDAGSTHINVPPDVTLASDRGINDAPGAHIYTAAEPGEVIQVNDGARLTGIRLEGPHPGSDTTGSSSASGVEMFHTAEVDNCEIWGFSFAGIDIEPSTVDAHIHHNVIRECNKDGLGYGVSVDGGNPIIEYNYFNYNRHDVATTGDNYGYRFRYNHCGPLQVLHNIDAHSPAGTRYEIHNNVVETIFRTWDDLHNHIVVIRDVPNDECVIWDNWFFADEAIPSLSGPTDTYGQVIIQTTSTWQNMNFYGNHYGTDPGITYEDIIPGYNGYRTTGENPPSAGSQAATINRGTLTASAFSPTATIGKVVSMSVAGLSLSGGSPTTATGSVSATPTPSSMAVGAFSPLAGVYTKVAADRGRLRFKDTTPTMSVGPRSVPANPSSLALASSNPRAIPGVSIATPALGGLSVIGYDATIDLARRAVPGETAHLSLTALDVDKNVGAVSAIGDTGFLTVGGIEPAVTWILDLAAVADTGELVFTGLDPTKSTGPVSATTDSESMALGFVAPLVTWSQIAVTDATPTLSLTSTDIVSATPGESISVPDVGELLVGVPVDPSVSNTVFAVMLPGRLELDSVDPAVFNRLFDWDRVSRTGTRRIDIFKDRK
ncbi:hypothetical protein [Halorubellus litoreus]|uniref:Right handed beta helix region n=1 Tax=Halorubellus litoreus TaxID=755308 RepID=A0ABD5VFA8_9EURY